MGQSRVDKTYPPQKHTRHVWVQQAGPQQPPLQGYVLEWRRHSYRWSALVVVTVVDEKGQPSTCTEWLPAEVLTPVKSDPNTGRQRYL